MSNPIDAWKGEFGDAYHARQPDRKTDIGNREKLWAQVLNLLPRVNMKILEVGAGTGTNLDAIQKLYQSVRLEPGLYALEPNEKASLEISHHMVCGTADAIEADDAAFDLVFTYGVLIHLTNPLPAMREMYRVSRRYVMCAEYFAPNLGHILYREDVPLFKDDYGSLWMDNFDVKLIGYGFCWKRDTGLDNVTWWLFEKSPSRNPAALTD